jgi:hypothetical protein
MKVAIMQPTYLPWIGYFALMESVDTFIILDSVQFSKRSWQQRNQIKTESGLKWLTVPVISKGKREQLITDVEIDYFGKFPENHINMIKQNYKKSPFFNDYSEKFFNIFRKKHKYLSLLSVDLILLIRVILNIETEIKYSSNFATQGSKGELLAELCENVGAKEYISPPGSKVYLDVSEAFDRQQTQIRYFDYKHLQYPQIFDDFVPYMSVIDLLFNCGPESLSIIKKGIKI